MRNKQRQAFTIIELSIVLVIIGLIVGGVLSGKTMINNSRIRNIVSSVQSYYTAIDLFKLNYGGYYPGDIPNATSYFGATDVNGYTVNNGNGNGYIDDYTGTNTENYSVWQHLSLAGYINGIYTGATSGTNNYVPAINAPSSSYGPAPYYIIYSNTMYTGKAHVNYAEFNAISAQKFTVTDSSSIDLKIDDGLPQTGIVIAYDVGCAANLCANTSMCNNTVATHSTSTYYINCSGGTCGCQLNFAIDFIGS